MLHQAAKHREKKQGRFVVFALDTPSYPARMFGCQNPGLFPNQPCELQGTAIVISGGDFRSDESKRDEIASIRMNGVQSARNSGILRFAERALCQLVPSSSLIAISLLGFAPAPAEWLGKARSAGLEVLERGRGLICSGTSKQLCSFSWLRRLNGDSFYLLASDAEEDPLSRTEAAGFGAGVQAGAESPWGSFWQRFRVSPPSAFAELGDFRVFAGFGGADYANIFINVHCQAPLSVEATLANIAASIPIPLFCAGRLSERDAQGHCFADFSGWDTWQARPSTWTRVV